MYKTVFEDHTFHQSKFVVIERKIFAEEEIAYIKSFDMFRAIIGLLHFGTDRPHTLKMLRKFSDWRNFLERQLRIAIILIKEYRTVNVISVI